MSDHSPRLDLPYLQSAQAQKHVTHNEALRILDMVTQLTLVALDQTVPPALPQEGEVYALGLGASGDWLGHDGDLALLADGYWHFVTPQPGWMATLAGTDVLRLWTGSAWVAPAGPVLQNLPGVGVNTTSDALNRLAVASPNTLLSHEGAGHQLKINKASASETASLLFQDDWSGRAEMGLAGDDDFHIKVSADGSSWHEALSIDAGTGTVALALAPMARLDLAAIMASKAITAVDVLVYDTGRDSDGGAWRRRCQHTSWWNETLNTATRGARREFPAVAVIVAEAGKVTIHDGDDPALPMWRVLDFTGYSLKAIAARNGQIVAGLAANGVSILDFPGDALSVAPRVTTATTPALVNNATHDIALTVLPGAPADPATGLSVPTIAVATSGGVSVIRDDGSVVDIAYSAYSVSARVAFRGDGALVFSVDSSAMNQRWVHVFHRIPAADILEANGYTKGASDEHYAALYNAAYNLDRQWPGVWTGVEATSNGVRRLAATAWGSSQGLIRLAPDPSAPAKGMLAAISASHTSGWLVGATKGAWLAGTATTALVGDGTLSDPDRSTSALGLLVHGTLTRTAVAAGAELVGYGGWSAANYLEQAYNPALDFGTGDFCVMGWVGGTKSGQVFDRFDAAETGARISLIMTNTYIRFFTTGAYVDAPPLAGTGWAQVVMLRRSGQLLGYVNGVQVASVSAAASLTNTAAALRLGTRANSGGSPFAGALALWRIGATAPSAEQIRKIHADEKALFQPGAHCTLYGASDAVTALAEDSGTGLLHVGTSAGRSDFRGLRRIANTTTAVTTAISAAGGMIAEQ
ncbi:DUF2793 domain-containing protein [Pararhodobacter aggregans]|uniref:DUF2793 domain-containing protein n=1 Tax=Pararhodobacter aggregans TaxID=404875 RepID=UPI003A925877